MCHWAIILMLEVIKPHIRLYHGAPSQVKPCNALCLPTLQCQPPLVATVLDSTSNQIVKQTYNTNNMYYLGNWCQIFGKY